MSLHTFLLRMHAFVPLRHLRASRSPAHIPGGAARAMVTLLAFVLLTLHTAAHAQSIARVNLSTDPLYATTTVDKATITLALSVEWPTAGAQYTGNDWPDDSYSPGNEYLGYYDAESCYRYNFNPSDTPAGKNKDDYKRFVRTGSAAQRRCDGVGNNQDGFSGNYLNWASSSAIDMLRLALSGGDRSVDTPTLTLLQRAMVPNGTPECLWNTWNFPQKKLTRENGRYWGAVPSKMRAAATTHDIYAVNTLNRIYFATSEGGSCTDTSGHTLGSQAGTNQLNTDGFFYARAEVCSHSGGVLQDARDYALCKQYPDGNYKPIGAIQKYSDQLRLAAFGYVMDQTSERYGGVLRAPMKYVGPKTYDIYGRDNTPTTGNPQLEWNANNGVFFENPDQHAMGISGVINYLNRFGRTGPILGRYKNQDAVSELYYQSLRYLQGLPPTPAAVSGITTDMLDGFPVHSAWNDDPYGNGRSDQADYSCLRSNIVMIGDVYSHEGPWRQIPTTDNKAANVPNFREWFQVVQAFETGQSRTYVDGQGSTRTTSNPNPANSNAPIGEASQMTAYAYWAHTHDIRGADWTQGVGNKRRPGLRIKTFVFDVNENGAMNDASTRRYENPFFMTAKYGGFEKDAANTKQGPYNTWGSPFRRQDGTVDNNVWQKPSDPGEAATYYLQSSGRAVLHAFDEIFSRTSSDARSIAGSALTGNQISSTLSPVSYSAAFDTSNWSGDVVAERTVLNPNTNALEISSKLWSASAQLAALSNPNSSRNIWIGSGTHSTPAKNFVWSQLSSSQQTDLGKLSPTVNADAYGPQRVDYLRGDRSREGNPFRVRSSLLGDIVNSNVVLSGKPSTAYSGTAYQAFRSTYDTRAPAVLVGANDGMLHAFHATTGKELFAFIPSWVSRKLAALTDTNYYANHQNYVDAPLVAGEVQVASNGNASDWKTVLAGGTGGGGSGVFALDISNPAAFTGSNVLWEFTRTHDADMGQVIGQPKLIKLKTSGATQPTTYRWFVAVASGVNNQVPEVTNGPASTTGEPALFLLAVDKPSTAAWALGTNYYKVKFPVDSALSRTLAPGMANFAALYGASGQVTDMYAGDLHGNLWKLSFRDLAPADWNLNKLSFFNKGSAAAPKPYPMYIARDGAAPSNLQPITAAPSLFSGPVVGGLETYYVALGTGKYLESEDNMSTAKQSFYVLYDNGTTTGDVTSPTEGAIAGRARLRAGTVNAAARTISVPSFVWGRAPASASSPIRSGFYVDLPGNGEKLISTIVSLVGNNAAFNTMLPNGAGATLGSCTNAKSSGTGYQLNITNGAGVFRTSNVGALGAPVYLEAVGQQTTSPSDSTGRRVQTSVMKGLNEGQDGKGSTDLATSGKKVLGRLSWRQIDSYQDLRSSTP